VDILESLCLSIIMWFFGIIVILQAFGRKKEGGKLWEAYYETSIELGLKEKESSASGYGFPDILGRIRGRRIIIHPIVGKGFGGVAKTAYTIEHKIRFDKKIMISSTKISSMRLSKYRYKLELTNLKSPDYIVTSEKRIDQDIMNQLFDKNVTSHFNSIILKNEKKFFALFLESGIAIYYNTDWDEDKDVLKNNLLNLIKLLEEMEKNAPELDPNINNKLFSYTSKRGYSKEVDIVISAILIPIGVILVIIALFSSNILDMLFLINIGLVVILMGSTRIYAAKKNERITKVHMPLVN
jgi:hypothetical protein